MKVVILAGGLGTRLGEETDVRPKPMVEIGGKPILWHIMKGYSQHGFNEFVILLGYKGYLIKEFFANYFLHQGDVTIDLADNRVEVHRNKSEPWKVTLVETGLSTQTGGRLLAARDYLKEGDFMLTYGDGVSDVDVSALVAHHQANPQALVTMTTVQPEARFGMVQTDEAGFIRDFREKPPGDLGWINGGFMVCRQGVFDYLKEGEGTIFERAPLEQIAGDGRLLNWPHHGFWKCMDTLRDKIQLNQMWDQDQARWKTWS
ncbi:glucose-1-phosphate cytidylyltransferase [Herbaspirillum huttiense]|uniref:Glucose-1-phosphate cytidylyltransferase n=2 Tax=Herbaspirillum huttiense TaxID=863372 RepID=A0AAJ2HAP4_9BURK|nr:MULTISPECIES: glucose-1-phosphate cytidylyltransferase [Herbaspirillum]MAF04144.1 glucose-1-phosphate cytidylyltransferase [Herbaspirillum sp.]MBN9357732.1 glucose-1-phosphate cytidylyltransferase [Herbaspirillum huttiense]MBO14246.1 glucose-1-phosphate cytidylyltransferase [Herbaspirillum sp.]MCP3657912.1 glucose-1-phosphate cytidylyltransferase [Herbaspirillum sp.]MCP3946443.1 glucose-1-phosphate cytidylyltransferase [Herbaspirillum sp.]